MENKEKLIAFFKAENNRDWEKYKTFLSQDVKWMLYSKETKQISGIDDYMKVITDAYKGSSNIFTVESLFESEDKSRIAAVLINSLGERSCDIFDFERGKIINEYEFIL